MRFSLIVPIFNRPDEAAELLQSLAEQTYTDFELVLVEDGSTKPCIDQVDAFQTLFPIRYIIKENTGRSDSRNVGLENASADYFLFFDSDCIIPPNYLETVNNLVCGDYVDCFGGPDKEQASFTNLQKAINYAMTSFWTTGGIRGGKKKMERFEPRTFNMGFSRKVYAAVGGFKDMYGEDIELSNRIRRTGFSIKLFPEAFVFHKRRVNLKKFFRQVNIFGQARVNVYKLLPDSLRLVHTLPAFAVLGSFFILLLALLVSPWFLILHAAYLTVLFVDSLIKTKNLSVAALSLVTSFIQIVGYGIGFIGSFVKKILLNKGLEDRDTIQRVYK